MRAEPVTICTLYAIIYLHLLRRWLNVPVYETVHWQLTNSVSTMI